MLNLKPIHLNIYKTLLSLFLACVISLYTAPVFSKTVYTYIDANGRVTLSNKKPKSKNITILRKRHFKAFRDRSLDSGKTYFAKAIPSEYDSLINNLAVQHKMEPALIKAVVHIESAFQNEAVSHAGAMGLMQLMPKTAAIYDLTTDHFNPRKNLTAGITHLKYLLKRYKGDKRLSLAAYNAGETAVSRHDGIPPFKETQQYVKKVLHLYGKYKKTYLG